VRFASWVPVEGLMVSAPRNDTVRTYVADDSAWLIEGPVEREESDWRLHALDGIPQVFTVLVEVIISGRSLSLSSGKTIASLTYQR